MTTFPGSPPILKGGIVLQYNPATQVGVHLQLTALGFGFGALVGLTGGTAS